MRAAAGDMAAAAAAGDMAAAEAEAEGAEGDEREEEDEDEVEEQLVMVELSGIIDSDFLEKCENKCKILGIETERPILQVDRYVFAGEYEDALGTCVFFEENTEHVDAEGNQKLQLKYKCHTLKKLNMTRTLLTEKKEGEEGVALLSKENEWYQLVERLGTEIDADPNFLKDIFISLVILSHGVEWLQIKDRDFSYSRPNMICSFLHEQEDSEESAQAPDKLMEESEGEVSDRGNADPQCDLEKQHGLGMDATSVPLPGSPASEAEDSPSGSAALDGAPP